MCWFKKKPKPDWVTQTREQVAQEEELAAGLHLSLIEYLKETPDASPGYGTTEWNEYWAQKHQEASFYILHPEVK